jgi:hypothetical protein
MTGAGLPDLLDVGEFGAGVAAHHVFLGSLDGNASQSAFTGDLDDVGQVVLALGIVIADCLEQAHALRARKRDDSAIAEINGKFIAGGVLVLADRNEFAVAFEKPSIPGWIGCAETENHHVSAPCPFISGRCKTVRIDERGISIKHDDVVKAFSDHVSRHQHGMSGALAFGLLHGAHRHIEPGSGCLRDALGIAANHKGNLVDAGRSGGTGDMGNQRQIADGMQNLGFGRLHPCRIPRRKHDCQTCPRHSVTSSSNRLFSRAGRYSTGT